MAGYRYRMRAPVGRTMALSTAADACCVVAFVAIGRRAHHDGDTMAGIWQTAWPFLSGLAVGLLLARAWRRPMAIRPAGVGAWLGAAGAGMVIRVLAGQGTSAAFVAVAFAFLGLFLLGWRTAALFLCHFRHSGPL